MKQFYDKNGKYKGPSLPTRERGLKHHQQLSDILIIVVAPHAGAWIETMQKAANFQKLKVAPHAGAWIETIFCLY